MVQVNGKVRGKVEAPAGSSQEEVERAALDSPHVSPHVEGKPIVRTVYVPGRLLNVVVD